MVEEIKEGELLLAIILRNDFNEPGVHFVTPGELSQQLAYMKHPAGKKIEAHVHKKVSREVDYTQEVLMIKKGKLKVYLYDNDQKFITDRVLNAGDVILLAHGGHGFEVMEEVEMIEVKQGPFVAEEDKQRFDAPEL